jgi:hypothetical protein
MNNEITLKIIDDLERKMERCLNGDWTPTQCCHYAYGVERTIRAFVNTEDFDVALRLLHIFMRVMERLMKNE